MGETEADARQGGRGGLCFGSHSGRLSWVVEWRGTYKARREGRGEMERWRYEGFRKKFEGVMSRTLVAKPESGFIFRTSENGNQTGARKKTHVGSFFFFSISKKRMRERKEWLGEHLGEWLSGESIPGTDRCWHTDAISHYPKTENRNSPRPVATCTLSWLGFNPVPPQTTHVSACFQTNFWVNVGGPCRYQLFFSFSFSEWE